METFRARHFSELNPEMFSYEIYGDRFEQLAPIQPPKDKEFFSLFMPNMLKNSLNYSDLRRLMQTFRNLFCPESMNHYQYEEVNLSSIEMGDVIIFNDCLIPFWTPYKITKKTIILTPCAVNRKIGKRLTIRARDTQGTMAFEGYKPEYGFTNRPLKSINNFIVDSSEDVECLCGKTVCECNEKVEIVDASIFEHHMRIKFNKRTTRRNGIHQEIKVRKFTGTEDQMILHNFQTDENYYDMGDPHDKIPYLIQPVEKRHVKSRRLMEIIESI